MRSRISYTTFVTESRIGSLDTLNVRPGNVPPGIDPCDCVGCVVCAETTDPRGNWASDRSCSARARGGFQLFQGVGLGCRSGTTGPGRGNIALDECISGQPSYQSSLTHTYSSMAWAPLTSAHSIDGEGCRSGARSCCQARSMVMRTTASFVHPDSEAQVSAMCDSKHSLPFRSGASVPKRRGRLEQGRYKRRAVRGGRASARAFLCAPTCRTVLRAPPCEHHV